MCACYYAKMHMAGRSMAICLGVTAVSWAEAHIKIARMTLTVKLDRNWSSFQLANSAPPLSVTDSAIAPSARMQYSVGKACLAGHPPPASHWCEEHGADACRMRFPLWCDYRVLRAVSEV